MQRDLIAYGALGFDSYTNIVEELRNFYINVTPPPPFFFAPISKQYTDFPPDVTSIKMFYGLLNSQPLELTVFNAQRRFMLGGPSRTLLMVEGYCCMLPI